MQRKVFLNQRYKYYCVNWAPCHLLRRLEAGRIPLRTGLESRPVYVETVVEKVTLGQVFLRVLRVPPVNVMTPTPHVIRCITSVYDSIVKKHT